MLEVSQREPLLQKKADLTSQLEGHLRAPTQDEVAVNNLNMQLRGVLERLGVQLDDGKFMVGNEEPSYLIRIANQVSA